MAMILQEEERAQLVTQLSALDAEVVITDVKNPALKVCHGPAQIAWHSPTAGENSRR